MIDAQPADRSRAPDPVTMPDVRSLAGPLSAGRGSPYVDGLLPDTIHENLAAVLLVDLSEGSVTYVNETAQQLAPGAQLPVPVDEWSRTAGLRDFAGDDLPEGAAGTEASGSQSLLRVAAGEPVFGEAVTAARRSDRTDAREPMWVLGLPLTDGPEPLNSMALVVFLPMRDPSAVADAQQSAASLRDRALGATRIAFTISDPRRPDNPLVWVNPAFTETTGYTLDEVVGRNCRFLQGSDTDRRVVRDLAQSVGRGQPVTTTLLNYRKDGSSFWNQLTISPVLDPEGQISHFVGVQVDVSDRVYAERTREAALARAERAGRRLALIASFTRDLAARLDADGVLQLLARSVVPRLGTWSIAYLPREDGGLDCSLHHERADDPSIRAILDEVGGGRTSSVPADNPLFAVLRGELAHVIVDDVHDLPPDSPWNRADERWELSQKLGLDSIVMLPMVSRDRIIGAFALVGDSSRAPFGHEDLLLLQDLVGRAAMALENASLYNRQRDASETLQRGLLPTLPAIDGLAIDAQYLPATVEAAVGGDWYDVFPLANGDVGMAVGDVMGHDLAAAPSMGQLRSMLRSYAWPGDDPGRALDQVDQLVDGLRTNQLATCFYGQLHLDSVGARLTYANAGHPPPAVLHPDGQVELLSAGQGRIIGVRGLSGDTPVVGPSQTAIIPRGSTIVCYTDGLVDAFGLDIDEALQLLRAEIARLAHADTGTILRRLVRRVDAEGRRDDVTVLAVTVR